MPDTPVRPPEADHTGPGLNHRSRARRPIGTYPLAAAGVVAIVVLLVLHITGVLGPGAH